MSERDLDHALGQAKDDLDHWQIRTPDLSELEAHRRHSRRVRMTSLVLVAIIGVSLAALQLSDPPSELSESVMAPVPDTAVGLGESFIWTNPARNGDPVELAEAFGHEVLGWSKAAAEITRDDGAGTLTVIISAGGRSDLLIRVSDRDGHGWAIYDVGAEGLGLLCQNPGPSCVGRPEPNRLTVNELPPDDTHTIRVWVRMNGEELAPVTYPPNAPILTQAGIDDLESVLIVFLDEHGHALSAAGGTF